MEPSEMPPPVPMENGIVQQSCGLATASLVFGILSFCLLGPFAAIPAIICGIIALSKIGGAQGRLRGSGLAIAGISLGGVSLALTLLILPAIMLPALARAREAARRSSCQNNLKQMGLVFKLFANEKEDQYFPELSVEPGKLMCTAKDIFPEYLTDPSILHCPSDADPPKESSDPEQLVNDESYVYLGYAITSDEELAAFAEVYKERVAKGLPFNEDLPAPSGLGSGGSDKFYRLREGVERLLVEDTNNPSAAVSMQSKIPIMWDSLGSGQGGNPMFFNHIPGGSNVLYMDGHVEFWRYPGEFPVSREAAQLFSELDSLSLSQ